MFETNSQWKETSHDCQFCGGIIYQRTDYENGEPVKTRYQCRECDAQWNMQGKVVRAGRSRSGKTIQPAAEPNRALFSLPRWLVWGVVAFVGIAFLFYTRLFVVLFSMLVPLTILTMVGCIVFYLGRHYGWWQAIQRRLGDDS